MAAAVASPHAGCTAKGIDVAVAVALPCADSTTKGIDVVAPKGCSTPWTSVRAVALMHAAGMLPVGLSAGRP